MTKIYRSDGATPKATRPGGGKVGIDRHVLFFYHMPFIKIRNVYHLFIKYLQHHTRNHVMVENVFYSSYQNHNHQ